MHQSIPFVDIFAGPGGLSEGFSSFSVATSGEDFYPFRSIISAEKEESAFHTLRMRAFLRFFIYNKKYDCPPEIYIDYVTAKTNNEKKSPAYILADILHVELEDYKTDSEFKTLLAGSLRDRWQNFSKDYSDELDDILNAALHAREEVKHFELGGGKNTSNSGDITPHIAIALRRFNNNEASKNDFILVGGPPCQAYSNAGRSRRSGNVKSYTCDESGEYVFDRDPRATLYKEYLKVLNQNEPAFFVMENVRGMLSAQFSSENGTKEPVWKRVVSELHNPSKSLGSNTSGKKYTITSLVPGKDCYYDGEIEDLDRIDPRDFLLRASDYGVPQHRDRVILLGIREDLLEGFSKQAVLSNAKLPSTENHAVSVGTAINDLPPLFSTLSSMAELGGKKKSVKASESEAKWKVLVPQLIRDIISDIEHPDSTLSLESISNLMSENEELKIDDRCLSDKLKEVLQHRITELLSETERKISTLTADKEPPFTLGDYQWKSGQPSSELLSNWYKAKSKGLPAINHYSRGHMDTDLARYVYIACYAVAYQDMQEKIRSVFPSFDAMKARDFLSKKCRISDRVNIDHLKEAGLQPYHQNTQSFVDRFKVQRAESPSTTVTCHISKDGHYYIHPDPVQCRSLTVREAARLQTFPDNYFFEGKPTQQRTQVGNAVPPYLALHISNVLFSLWNKLL